MKREIRYGAAALRNRATWKLAAWSLPEALPSAVSGLAVARALDAGFLAGRPGVGLAWLGGMLAAAGVGAVGARQVFRHLGEVVEPFRDSLATRVVAGALDQAVAGRADDGAVARLTRQVEIVRDTYAGLIVVLRGFVVTLIGVAAGLLSLAPVMAPMLLGPMVLALLAFAATLGISADRQRAAVFADERLASTAGSVLAGARDVAACGTRRHAAAMVAGPVAEQAAAERALARVAMLRVGCFAVGGWLPLLILLAAAPWLVGRGVTVGAVIGGLTYVLIGVQPALRTLMSGVGGAGLRYVVTLGRILDASPGVDRIRSGPARLSPAQAGPARLSPAQAGPVGPAAPLGALTLRGLTFAYGPHAEPVLRDLDLTVPPGGHLAIVGPSGIGKSTLANLLCGLLRPDAGAVELDGVPVARLRPAQLAAARTLIPQEAYVFAGTVRENLTYLRPEASPARVLAAIRAIGAADLVDRIGGLTATVDPATLSAGERQLISLVRAYLSPAPLVVLDEATCHLDPVAERRAEEAFAARRGTLIVIAHRVTSVLRARRVLVLDGAGAVEGDHRAVLAASPLYRELIHAWQPDLVDPPDEPPEAGTPGRSQIQPAS